MDEIDLEVLPKKSVQAFRYLGTPIFFVVGLFILFDNNVFESPALNTLLFIVGALTILMSLLWIPHTYKFRINFGPESIKQSGLVSKEISYQDIQKLVVRKGFVEICGKNLFKRISIGDLYMNFNPAIKVLQAKAEEEDQIVFTGQKKYIEEYFNSAA